MKLEIIFLQYDWEYAILIIFQIHFLFLTYYYPKIPITIQIKNISLSVK